MAKTNKEAIIRLCRDIDKKEGTGAIFSLGSKKEILKVPRWTTGIEDLDHIIGGGIPEGRIIEIFGPESSGKTSLSYHLCSMTSLCLFIPAEGTFDNKRARIFGNKPKQMLVYRRCKYAEDILEKVMQFSEAGIPLIVIDSIPGMVPKSMYEQVEKDIEKEPRRGQLASLFSRTLKPINDVIEFTGTTIIFINQVRDKMDAMMFGEKTQTPGGRALRHYSSIRIQVGRKAWIEVPNKNPINAAKDEKVGLIMKTKVIKSKVCNPMMEAEIPLFFDRGFRSFNDIKDIRKEIMNENNKKLKGELNG